MADGPNRPSRSSSVGLIAQASDPHNVMYIDTNTLQSVEVSQARPNSPNSSRHDFLASVVNIESPPSSSGAIYANEFSAMRNSSAPATRTQANMAAPMFNNNREEFETLKNMCMQNSVMIKQMHEFMTNSQGNYAPKQSSNPCIDVSDSESSSDDLHGEETQSPSDKFDSFVSQAVDSNTKDADTTNESDKIIQSMKDFYGDGDKTGPEINNDLAEIISSGFHVRVPEEKTKKLSDMYFRPKNIDKFVVPKTNESVWPSLRRRSQDIDANLQKIQGYQMKGLVPTTQAFDKLLTAAQTGKGLTPQDTSECVKLLQHSIQLGQFAFNELTYRRRYFMKGDLKSCYRQLCNDSNPVTNYLLGDNVEAKMKDMDTAQKVGNKVSNKRPHTSGNSNSKRFHPYGPTGHYNKNMSKSSPFHKQKDFYRKGQNAPKHFLGKRERREKKET
ncbi:hypothetical protein FSP39_000338 [Pinctada imbricata]|uniref:Uncharacterized protein n=1 Tax=Pinctada imbricata TaxID=66713 RepID=A0AA88YGR2_PINIB|nr:hypothetical protein FSP39_000338 [Pinctada imbricata]